MKPMVYAHRGASKYAPENTMAAFEKAVEMGAQGIELDTHLTSDGHLVVTHDDILGRTCSGSGMVKDKSLSQLRQLDFGSWFGPGYEGEKIPLLQDVIELLQNRNMVLNIEIKATPGQYNAGIEKKVVELVRSCNFADRVIISSFNHYMLLSIKDLDRGIRTAPLYGGLLANVWKYAKELGAEAVHPNFNGIVADTFDGCGKKGILVNVWTVDREEDITRIAAMGADGIITNVPDVALRAIGLNGRVQEA